jgi:hypothetical protein
MPTSHPQLNLVCLLRSLQRPLLNGHTVALGMSYRQKNGAGLFRLAALQIDWNTVIMRLLVRGTAARQSGVYKNMLLCRPIPAWEMNGWRHGTLHTWGPDPGRPSCIQRPRKPQFLGDCSSIRQSDCSSDLRIKLLSSFLTNIHHYCYKWHSQSTNWCLWDEG